MLRFSPRTQVFLLWAAAVCDLYAQLGRKNNAALNCNASLGRLHSFLMFATWLTIGLGLVYEVRGQYAQELEVHKLWGYIVGVMRVLNYVLFCLYRRRGGLILHSSCLLSLAAASCALTVAGHQGGELVHGKGFLSKPFKIPLLKAQPAGHLPSVTSFQARSQSLVGHATTAATTAAAVTTLSIDRVQAGQHLNQVPICPIRAKKHCYSCHGATKQKGELRLDSPSFAKAAGQSGKLAIVAYDAAASLLI